MPIDRADTLRKAEKFLRQGKLDSAIAEYLRVVEEQPRDWNAANTLGDLYVRAGQTDKAVEQFVRIADSLNEEGFCSKAAALYKKALKIKPDDEHSLLQGAEISASQGLLADARTYLNAVARPAKEPQRRTRRRADPHPSRVARSRTITTRGALAPMRACRSATSRAPSTISRGWPPISRKKAVRPTPWKRFARRPPSRRTMGRSARSCSRHTSRPGTSSGRVNARRAPRNAGLSPSHWKQRGTRRSRSRRCRLPPGSRRTIQSCGQRSHARSSRAATCRAPPNTSPKRRPVLIRRCC